MPTRSVPESATGEAPRPTSLFLSVAAALVIVAAPMIVGHRLTSQSVSPGLTPEALPMEIGPWLGREAHADAKELARAGLTGHVSRRYVNRATGAEILILLMWGPTGPLSVHTPDLCFGGAGYT
ncbi:exosortase-associated EpsI family protein, partial [Singulisphaera rosea]